MDPYPAKKVKYPQYNYSPSESYEFLQSPVSPVDEPEPEPEPQAQAVSEFSPHDNGYVTTVQPYSSYPIQVPPGLESLTELDRIFIRQEIEPCEIACGVETNNRYKIKGLNGRELFYANEENDCCTRTCCGPLRPFEIHIFDISGQEVIRIQRPLACQGCCCPCCLQKLEVYSPPWNLIGTVEQEWSLFSPQILVRDADGFDLLRIEGPTWRLLENCFGSSNYRIFSLDGGTRVGKVKREWPGCCKEQLADADKFTLRFPADMDIKLKAVLIGASFLIDFMYYERGGGQGRRLSPALALVILLIFIFLLILAKTFNFQGI